MHSKKKYKKTNNDKLFKKIKNKNIIDEFIISKDFDNNNIQYSWDEENYITEYSQKRKAN